MSEQDARGALTVARAEGKLEGRLEGERTGELRGKRAALLRVLTRAGLAPAGEDLARIEACSDAATLDRWLENAVGATSLADVLT
jgi:hypothetical protein